jgi:murein DD-endopeptidase MepM/ murein hydrolase activator NlpD
VINILHWIGIAVIAITLILVGAYIQQEKITKPLQEQIEILNVQHEDYRHEIAVLKEQLNTVNRDKAEIEALYASALDKIGLLTALRDSGMIGDFSTEDIRSLLEIADSIPYGSPFASGHWISSKFGLRDESMIRGDNYTEGIDLVGKNGDRTIRTTADGVIIDYGVSDVYGKYIVVEHNGVKKTRTYYAHLSKIFYQDDLGNVKGIPLNKGDK